MMKEGKFGAVWLERFRWQAVVSMERSPGDGSAVVVMEEVGRKAVAVELGDSALAAGARPGMTAPQVLARCPEAVLKTRSVEMEKAAREALLTAAFAWSPRVEETGDGLCTVDLRGIGSSLGQSALAIHRSLQSLGLEARIGIGRNPLLAWFAARRADPVLEVEDEKSFLAELPVSVAEPPPAIAEVLDKWGVKTLGAFSALPRQEIARRLGSEGSALWDRAAGREERVLRLATLPEEFEQGIELEQEMETLEPLLFILRRFIDRLSLRLGAVHQVAEEVGLELGLADRSVYERSFRLPEPTRNPELLFRMLHTHLEGVRTEHPIVKIHLRMTPCKPVSKQHDLFEAAVKDPYSFSDTLARLVAVVGSGNVGSPRLEPTHRPDAFRMEPLADIGSRTETTAPVREILPMRRYRPPVAVRVWMAEGRPVQVESNEFSLRIQNVRGPWRLSGNWWEPRRWAREEWDIECADGGHYRLVREKKDWYLEGEYG